MTVTKKSLLYTIKERCRMCYTCVRECPAKAIRVTSGQAEIVPERCICCGNCVAVCSQKAKKFSGSEGEITALVESGEFTAAIIAPSFPAEFDDIDDYKTLVSMIRQLGFNIVSEVAFGADIVANAYRKILENGNPELFQIVANCPAVVSFIERYHPALVPNIARIVSPMVAMTRVLKQEYGENIKVVFIGPCIAKKNEINDPLLQKELAGAITFGELREMFARKNITPESAGKTKFDPPVSGRGALFPVSRGMLQTIRINEDISSGSVIVAEGRTMFTEALREFEEGVLKKHHLDLLCCEGCIMGPGMANSAKRFVRRTNVSDFVRRKLLDTDENEWQCYFEKYKNINLYRDYVTNDQRVAVPSGSKIMEILRSMGKESEEDMLNCGACGYETCALHAVAVFKGLAESEMCLPNTIEKLHRSFIELEKARAALKHSEKLASMGQLAAGIAHEVNNPLGVVLLYSNLLLDEIPKESEYFADVKMVAEQAERCKNIVGGLLNFARKNDVDYKLVNVRDVVAQSMNSVIKPQNVTFTIVETAAFPEAELDPGQIRQVLTNLIKNSVDALEEINGGEVVVYIEGTEKEVSIRVSDNGPGIPDENMEKLFVPFFTTKPAGKGTGLGLPVSYGILKMHRGNITVNSNSDPAKGERGTSFIITVPRKRP